MKHILRCFHFFIEREGSVKVLGLVVLILVQVIFLQEFQFGPDLLVPIVVEGHIRRVIVVRMHVPHLLIRQLHDRLRLASRVIAVWGSCAKMAG